MQSESNLRELVRLAYVAAGNPTEWTTLLQCYGRTMAASCVWFMFWDRRTQDSAIVAASGSVSDGAALRDYNAYYRSVNPLMRHGVTYMRPGAVTLSHLKYPIAAFLRSEFYQDYARKLDLAYSHAMCLSKTDDVQAHVSCIRSLRGGAYDRHDARFARRLVPHLQRTLQIHERLRGLRLDGSTDAGALDRLTIAVFIVSSDARVMLTNERGRQLLLDRNGLESSPSGLRASRTSDTKALRTMIAAAARSVQGDTCHSGGVVRLVRRSHGIPLVALVAPMVPRLTYPTVPTGCVTLFVHDPIQSSDNRALLAQLYGLTRSEAELAIEILTGHTIDVAADALAIGKETARSHLKAILRKSGTPRQAAFVRAALASMPGQIGGAGLGETVSSATNSRS